MSTWRARGYVPDSDDEDLELDGLPEPAAYRDDLDGCREGTPKGEGSSQNGGKPSQNGGDDSESMPQSQVLGLFGSSQASTVIDDTEVGNHEGNSNTRVGSHQLGQDENQDLVVLGKLPRIKTYRSRYKHIVAQHGSDMDSQAPEIQAPEALHSATDVGNFFPSSPASHLPQSSPVPEQHDHQDLPSGPSEHLVLESSTNVGNFFPSSPSVQLPELLSLEGPSTGPIPDLRRASITSSDLSDVDMDLIASSPLPFPVRMDSIPAQAAKPTINLSEENHPTVTLPRAETTSLNPERTMHHDYDHMAAPTRHFRTRKAIQLHPYMLEQEKYRQALKARGYRPVQVATTQQRSRDDLETQDHDFAAAYSASQTQETTPPDSSEPSSQVQTAPTRARLPLLRLDDSSDEDDFAQYDNDRHIPEGIQAGFKRRKTVETPFGASRESVVPSLTSTATGKLRSLGLLSRVASVSDGPPTPPRTSSPINVDKDTARVLSFRRPRGLTPPPADNSAPSSPPTRSRNLSRLLPALSDSSDSEPSTQRSTSPDPQAEAQHLRRLQKRIKGVLPASWLKLDRKTQTKASSSVKNHLDQAPPPSGPVRGIAQRFNRHVGPSPRIGRESIVLSDDSDTSDELPRQSPRNQLDGRSFGDEQGPLPDPFGDNDDLEEHDEIDRMFSTTKTSEPTNSTRKSRKQQSRITDTFVRPEGGAQPRVSAISKNSSGGANGRGQPRTRTKAGTKRPRPAKLSILDVTGGSDPSGPSKPPFLRLAARQARKRRDLGRHSPTRKQIRLATHQETLDAHAVLQSWSNGSLRPSNFADRVVDTRRSDEEMSVTTSRTIRRAVGRVSIRVDRRDNASTPRRYLPHKPVPLDVPLLPSIVRPGQLETFASKHVVDRDFLTFAPPPSRLMEIFRKDKADGAPSRFRLERFLDDHDDDQGMDAAAAEVSDAAMEDVLAGESTATGSRSRRKRLAQRIDIEMRSFRQPIEPLPSEVPVNTSSAADVNHVASGESRMATLHGLGPYGTRYPTDFDVRPLELGTHFHASTFIGSGDFAKSLDFDRRDLDLPTSRSHVEFFELSFCYGAWNEEVSAGLDNFVDHATKRLHSPGTTTGSGDHSMSIDTVRRIADALRSLLDCSTRSLHFTDAVDRKAFVNRMSQFLDDLFATLQGVSQDTNEEQPRKATLNCVLYLLCLNAQAVRVSQHSAVDLQTRATIAEQTVKFSRRAVALCFQGNMLQLREFMEDHRRHAVREAGIQDYHLGVKCVVIIHHVLHLSQSATTLSGILLEQADLMLKSRVNIKYFDQVWYDIFTLQPFLEFDANGMLRTGSRFHNVNDHWDVVKSLLQRLFQLYPASAQSANPTLNDYVRACLSRTYVLIGRWGWRRCEAILNVMYDFFASKGFAQLHQERGKGSPAFLEDLDKQPALDLAAGDSAFHIFLKILVIGLQALQSVYPLNKIRGIAWRFIPNHGRTYRKDQEVTQSDLDALRNNHDLLCTLYWVLPQGSGPRLQMIQNLVDHVSSHREACRLSSRAWGMLAKFQMSTGRRFADLKSLTAWFRDMITTTISQYRLARSEAEAQLEAQNLVGDSYITHEVVEMTIAANQRGILAILLDLLQALDRAIKVSIDSEISLDLVQGSGLTEVFKLFDPDQPRVFAPIIQALETIQVLHRDRPQISAESQQESEDSQEYGDWSHLADTVTANATHESDTSVVKATDFAFLHEPLSSLLSSAFGADRSPHDDFLRKLVQVWTLVATEHVKAGVHGWSTYLDVYNSSSWFQLRSTDQTRKFTALFLSAVLDADKTSVQDYRCIFLGRWLVSLLERESMLKFQHKLTGSLLNSIPSEPLLQNLPFASNRAGKLEITLTDLRERRTSLIDSILFNMHAHHSNAIMLQARSATQSGSALALKSEYEEMLKQAMTFMRTVYEALQQPLNDGSDEMAQGAYVSFAQHVVSLMQQYTSDICRIDKFFVDSSVFPLPSLDPTYVVGRLKRYAFKMGDSRARKELAVFINTVSERAAIDNEQSYLVRQLHQAMTGKLSDELRGFLLTSIFPAYLDAAHSTGYGWCLALPLISASALVFQDLIYDVRPDVTSDVAMKVGFMTKLLYHLYQGAIRVAERPLLLLQPEVLHLLGASFEVLRSSLTFGDHIKRCYGHGGELVKLIRLFVKIGDYLVRLLQGDEDVFPPDMLDMPDPEPPQYRDTSEFSRKALREGLSRWTERNGVCMIVKGNSAREVQVARQLGSMEEEREAAMAAIDSVLEDYGVIFRRKIKAQATAGLDEIFI